MNDIQKYLKDVFGLDVLILSIDSGLLGKLPVYITELYVLTKIQILNSELIFARHKADIEMGVKQTYKHFQQIKKVLNLDVVLISDQMMSYKRKRLIQQGINFLVPGKQLFLPVLMMNLSENFGSSKKESSVGEYLLPSSQLILLYHLFKKDEGAELEGFSFKEIAMKIGYSAMAISNAVDNLKNLSLVEVYGGKTKYIRFLYKKYDLWRMALVENRFINPIIKTVYIDNLPENYPFLKSNLSALSCYSDINSANQQYYAIEKTEFYKLIKSGLIEAYNEYEGDYALEIWKYDPKILADKFSKSHQLVDPLSLYLCFMNSSEARIEIALDEIIAKFIW
jgi:hypothetical protein